LEAVPRAGCLEHAWYWLAHLAEDTEQDSCIVQEDAFAASSLPAGGTSGLHMGEGVVSAEAAYTGVKTAVVCIVGVGLAGWLPGR
jgi:hypothetical protein